MSSNKTRLVLISNINLILILIINITNININLYSFFPKCVKEDGCPSHEFKIPGGAFLHENSTQPRSRNLSILNMDGLNIRVLNGQQLLGLHNLQELSLSSTLLKNMGAETLWTMSKLEKLDLSNNQWLVNLPKDIFKGECFLI